eukprot:gb/GFBE01031433.1/.p1 GENE.gb/GFBE01031433.1/~~gb/GFBE01031433.1/.p1  ORF type:complete len:224 (+),score=61.12 gb/GFBE01031433.1/:1-672(+)
MQEEWDATVKDAKIKKADLEAQIRHQEDMLSRKCRDIDLLVEKHEQKLAATCRRMCGEADEHKARESTDAATLMQSRLRADDQKAAFAKAAERQVQLQGSLDRSKRKLEDLLATHAKMQRNLEAARIHHFEQNDAELAVTRERTEDISEEVREDVQALAEADAFLVQVRQVTNDEQRHILRMEDYIRRVANQDSRSLRTGGGYCIDNLAKIEAQALVQELLLA